MKKELSINHNLSAIYKIKKKLSIQKHDLLVIMKKELSINHNLSVLYKIK
jgi:hypothetical protein